MSAQEKWAKPNGHLPLELLQIHAASRNVNFAD
jgi:hypothetical protein